MVGFRSRGQHVTGTNSDIIVQINNARDGVDIVLYARYMLTDSMVDRIVLVLVC